MKIVVSFILSLAFMLSPIVAIADNVFQSNASVLTVPSLAANQIYTANNLSPYKNYVVRVYFMEPSSSASQTVNFSVLINGATPSSVSTYSLATAGGQEIGIVSDYIVSAGQNGTITIQMVPTGSTTQQVSLEVIPNLVASASPAPTSTPTATPQTPIYSNYFTAKTPFHDTVAQLMAAGATVLNSQYATNYWAQGIANTFPLNPSNGTGPIYFVHAGDPAYIFSCTAYGACNANGLLVHYPQGAIAAPGSDHHIISFDTIQNVEIDGWGGFGGNQACNLNPGNPGTATCSWGGAFTLNGGNGLESSYGSTGDAGGYAYGLMLITQQELANGYIGHALGIISSCLDSGGVYPSTIGRTTDSVCSNSGNAEPQPSYGHMIHLKSSVNIASLGYSYYCQVILQAFQTFGAYTADNNGGYGLSFYMEYPENPDYTFPSLWDTLIWPSMVAGNDGQYNSYYNGQFTWNNCLQRIPASDIEVIQISPTLP